MRRILENFFLKTLVKLAIDVSMLILGYCFTLVLKYDFKWSQNLNLTNLILYLLLSVIVFYVRKTQYKTWAFINTKDLFLTSLDILVINLVYFFITIFKIIEFPRHLILGNLFITSFFLIIPRFLTKGYMEIKGGKKNKEKKCLIIGAGTAGDMLLREYNRNNSMDFEIVGLIDDDPIKKGFVMHNYKVLGDTNDLVNLIEEYGVNMVILAIPSAKSEDVKRIYSLVKNSEVEMKILPDFNEILNSKTMNSQLRDVEVEDLLGRDAVEINTKTINGYIEDKIVFVTGGGGSIGSELSRQISKYNPRLIVNIDVNENTLYFLELEIKRIYPNVNIISEVCNIREREKLEYLFEKYEPQLVYHAAAHKHVPLMEHNPEEAIKNNVFGSKNVLELANKYNVERVVLISTDKAVNPTNIMGATKRITEILLEQINKKSGTKYMAVRFGNVLGSNGSVIPIFKNLLKEGKNLTVTHPDITRYFMTIPEAAQLVLEAGGIGTGGEVFVLDMGKPVKILDLAKNLIELSGLTLGVDIEIEITGLRPGEKLYEELLYDVSSAIKTENKKIFIAKLKDEEIKIEHYMECLENLLREKKFDKIKKILKDFVTTYKEPEHHKCD